MIEKEIEIRTADGTADALLYQAEDGRRHPGVIHLTDIAGIRPSHRAMAKRLGEKGYTVLLPNIFYRTGRTPIFDFVPKFGEERTMKRFGELRTPLTPDAVERDAASYVDFLAASDCASAGAMGVVGYCFTGAFAMRMAAVRPAKIAAAASFHGGGLFTDDPTSPHLVLPKSRRNSTSGMRSKMPACRRRRSKSSIARSQRGAGNTKAKFTRARITDGRRRTPRFSTSRRPTAHSKS